VVFICKMQQNFLNLKRRPQMQMEEGLLLIHMAFLLLERSCQWNAGE
jgi:hypothetical protein